VILKKHSILSVPSSTGGAELVIGKAAIELLENKTFLAGWDELYQSCCWATPYQSKEYVCTWYQLYGESYLPIIIKAQEKDILKGLLTLALPSKKTKGKKRFIVAAGNFDSDYQTWLSSQTDGEAFIKTAIFELWKQFPRCELMLKYLPSQTPLNWIKSDNFWQQHCALQPFELPIMDMKAAEISGRNKKRVNRINKIGRFECVTDTDAFSSLLNNQIAQLFDFRQGALFNKNPFRNDPANRKLLLSLFEAGLLHVSILKINAEIIASVTATIGKKRAYLGGINCHSPLYASYSPGYLHFLLLGQQLAREGVEFFDLTPGYDFYKERLATHHEQVHQLVVTNNLFYFYKRQFRRWFHYRLVQAGKRPMSLELEIRKRLYLLRHRGLLACVSGWLKNFWPKSSPKLYLAEPQSVDHDTSILLQKDSLSDLLDFEQHPGKITRWEFLSAAWHRFEQGGHCYTWAEGGRLLACVWVDGSTSIANSQVNVDTKDCVWLRELYCHAAGRDRLDSFLRVAVAAVGGCTNVPVYTVATNAFMSREFEAAGFKELKEKKVVVPKNNIPEMFREFELKKLKIK
jgi:hypothetical protein